MAPIIGAGRIVAGTDREDVRYTFKGIYTFAAGFGNAAMGGAVSTIDLLDEAGHAVVLPDNFVIERATVNTLIALTSGGSATVALGSSEASKSAIIMAATGFGSAPFTADSSVAHCAALVTTPYKVTGTGIKLQTTIATATLTAGAFSVVVHGYVEIG